MAEREGFEPPIPVKVWLISSQLHSTGLCHLSAWKPTVAVDSNSWAQRLTTSVADHFLRCRGRSMNRRRCLDHRRCGGAIRLVGHIDQAASPATRKSKSFT
jgi:hypothetical protein